MGLIEYFEAEKIAKRYGIRSVRSAYVGSLSEAVRFANGKPIVLKAISSKALHKSKSGLVRAGLTSNTEISKAYAELSRKAVAYKPFKIIAQQMVKGGIEIIIGGKMDEQFGKLILIGLGGIYVEVFKDFALGVCPLKKQDAESMLQQLKSKGVIAPDKKSEDMIVELILRVSRMYSENKLSELDLNPIILHNGTYDAVDLRMIE